MNATFASTFRCGGLKANTKYGLSIQWQGAASGMNVGVSDNTSNANGVVIFEIEQEVLSAISKAPGPGTLTIWVRQGGGQLDDPPVRKTAQVTISVV